jgi:hypothetical protein
VERNRYLTQFITYIEMNMVCAGVIEHPTLWEFSGYNEIQHHIKRKGTVLSNTYLHYAAHRMAQYWRSSTPYPIFRVQISLPSIFAEPVVVSDQPEEGMGIQ